MAGYQLDKRRCRPSDVTRLLRSAVSLKRSHERTKETAFMDYIISVPRGVFCGLLDATWPILESVGNDSNLAKIKAHASIKRIFSGSFVVLSFRIPMSILSLRNLKETRLWNTFIPLKAHTETNLRKMWGFACRYSRLSRMRGILQRQKHFHDLYVHISPHLANVLADKRVFTSTYFFATSSMEVFTGLIIPRTMVTRRYHQPLLCSRIS